MQPKFDALYRAIVTSVIDTTNSGKIKVQCPQIGGMAEIRAAEPANPGLPVPIVGSIVWIGFSGGDITKPMYMANTIPSIPNLSLILDWQTPTLVSGFTQNGNNNGTVQYRVVNILGSNQVQWRGGLNLTYPGSNISNGGVPFSSAINIAARPTLGLRTLIAACSDISSTTLSLKFDTDNTGVSTIIGTTTSSVQPPWISLNGLSYFQ